MQVDQVIEVIQRGDTASPAPGPDLDSVRSRGRALRRRRRTAVGAGVVGLGVAASAIVALAVSGSPAGDEPSLGVAGTPQDDALTPWEHRALDAAGPGAYAVAGTVVVPGPIDTADDVTNMRFGGPAQLGADPVALGWHGYTDPGYVASTVTYPDIVERRQMLDDRAGKDVVADNGPVSLGCLSEGTDPCSPAVLVPGDGEDWFYLYGLGTDDFLEPGADMELFIDDLYGRSGATSSIIGGFDGVARRVELTLADGTVQAASIDAGVMSAGDTLFWAETPVEVTRVTAYDSDGDVVQERQVRDCGGGVDCEVR